VKPNHRQVAPSARRLRRSLAHATSETAQNVVDFSYSDRKALQRNRLARVMREKEAMKGRRVVGRRPKIASPRTSDVTLRPGRAVSSKRRAASHPLLAITVWSERVLCQWEMQLATMPPA
jgi:hypothetical protein